MSPYIETSQFVCTANQLAGFYMRATLALNELTDGMDLRSSHKRCSMKNGVLKNFPKFIGKHLCLRVFFADFGKNYQLVNVVGVL